MTFRFLIVKDSFRKERQLHDGHDFQRSQICQNCFSGGVRLNLHEIDFSETEDPQSQHGENLQRVVSEDLIPQQHHLIAGQISRKCANEPSKRDARRLNVEGGGA